MVISSLAFVRFNLVEAAFGPKWIPAFSMVLYKIKMELDM